MKHYIFILSLVFGLFSTAIECGPQIDCSAPLDDKVLDFDSLWNRGGSYLFPNTVVTGNQTQKSYTYEIQVCGSVKTQYPSICTDTSSAANRIDLSKNTCVSIGSINASGWNENVGNGTQGVNLVYYHGDTDTTNDIEFTSRIFFECGSSNQNVFNFQSVNTEFDQFIFSMVTPLACPSKSSTPVSGTTTTGGITSGSNTPIPNCGTFLNSSFVDFAPLFASNGHYLLVNTTGNENQTAFTFELQVCGLVKTNFPSTCTTPSAANRIDPVTQGCVSIGDINTITWEVDPDNKGVYAILYHGATFGDNEYEYSTRIFFECNSAQGASSIPINTMFFQNETESIGQYNFIISTPYACPSSKSTEPPRGSTTSSDAGFITPSLSYFLLSILILIFLNY